jgi:hypothetical protein
VLEDKYSAKFDKLIEATFKYFFLKGIVHNSVNAVKDTVFKVCASIENGDDFEADYQKSIGDDYLEFKRKIENRQYGRYLNGLVLTAAYLNPKQDISIFKKVIKNNYHIEHILPKKWNNYDKWTNETWEKNINAIGNLTPLEFNLNISARNEFFSRKKESYKKSEIQDALDLLILEDWYPSDFELRHEESQRRVLEFFK